MTSNIISFKKRAIPLLKRQKNQTEAIEKLTTANLKIEAQIRAVKQKAEKNIGIEQKIKLHMRLKQLVNQYQANKYLMVNKYGPDSI